MKRRDFIQKTSLAGLATYLSPSILKAQTVKTSPFEEIRNGVGIFTMRGGTIAWLQNKEAAVVVDTQFPEQASYFLNEWKQRQIDLLINTHHHNDHVAGNQVFIPNSLRSITHENSLLWQKKNAKSKGKENQLFPTETYQKNYRINLGSEAISMNYYGNAHTGGDSVIHFERANVAHLGDLVFNRKAPYIDTKSGADIQNWIQILEQISKDFDSETTFIFGHCGTDYKVTGGKTEILHFRDFLSSLLEQTDRLLTKGMSETEIVIDRQIKNFPDFGMKKTTRCWKAAYLELSK